MIAEWRWGAIAGIVEQLVPLQFLLKSTFSAACFQAFEDADEEKEEHTDEQGANVLPERGLSASSRVRYSRRMVLLLQ